MKKLNKQNGITLIALIITIIVMLILVGVTINVALNGGLFEKAKDAKERTVAATEKEQLLNAVFATLDDNGKIHLDNIELPDGFTKSESSDNVFIGPSGKEYEVSKTTGAITEVNEEDLGEYYLGIVERMVGLVEPTEEEMEEIETLMDKLYNEGRYTALVLEIDPDTEYSKACYYIDDYIICCSFDDETPLEAYIMTSEDKDYDKVNSILEEGFDTLKKLKTLLMGYTYTNDINYVEFEEYIESNIEKEFDFDDRGIKEWRLYNKASIDNNITHTYLIESTENSNSGYTIDLITYYCE